MYAYGRVNRNLIADNRKHNACHTRSRLAGKKKEGKITLIVKEIAGHEKCRQFIKV
jgi:hypothetical protein